MIPITTAEVMKLKDWPKLKEGLDFVIEEMKKETGIVDIQLVDKGTHWWIVVEGEPVTEIAAESMIPNNQKN